jgi:predicted Rossmann-fold nucleotide-binding protein
MVAASADGIIAVGGGVGTLIELSAGYMMKKPMVAVRGSGGTADEFGGKYLDERKRAEITLESPRSAVRAILNKIKDNAELGHEEKRSDTA